LRPGVTEVFFHAATRRWNGIADDLRDYALEAELDALTSADVAQLLRAQGAQRIAFADLPR